MAHEDIDCATERFQGLVPRNLLSSRDLLHPVGLTTYTSAHILHNLSAASDKRIWTFDIG